MADPYEPTDAQSRAAQEAAVENAQSTGEFVLSAAEPLTDGADWWVVFGIGGIDGPVSRSFEYRQPVA